MVKNNLLRVTQINATYFDNEIIKIFKEELDLILRTFPPGYLSKFQPELNATIKLVILYYSIIKCNRTFGQKLLSLQYANINVYKKFLYVFSNSIYDYLQERLELWNPNHKFNDLFTYINNILVVGRFINISLFLRNGKYPQFNERVLKLEHEYVDNNAQRFYDYKYMTRELLWNGLIEILVYILPLINYHKILRILKNFNPLYKKQYVEFIENPVINVRTKCAHCMQPPIHPYHMGCSHVFCYCCIRGNQAADVKYECPICGHSKEKCIRVNPTVF